MGNSAKLVENSANNVGNDELDRLGALEAEADAAEKLDVVAVFERGAVADDRTHALSCLVPDLGALGDGAPLNLLVEVVYYLVETVGLGFLWL